jgi:hypothetical protein
MRGPEVSIYEHILYGIITCIAGFTGTQLGHLLRDRRRIARFEAAQFEPGDVVTFGDGSYIVVASKAAQRQRPDSHE